MAIPVPVNQDNAYQIGRTFTAPQDLENAYISFVLDFTTNTQYQLDYATLDQPNIFGVAKSLYFDNLNNNQTVTVLVEGSNQRFQIPANSAGYYRLNSPTKTRINFTTGAAQAVTCNVAVYNFDVAPIIWYKTGIANNQVVYGPDDIGSPPTHPPVFVGGVDPSGNVIGVHFNAANEVLVSVDDLPLPAGAATEAKQDVGNASLSVLDDWDEADRAKVNPIVGQAGVAANKGNSSALTQRVIPAAMPYTLCPASATTNLGSAGAIGDYLSHVIIQPTLLTLAAFQILDNAVVIYDGTAQTLLDMRPIIIPIGTLSVSGTFKVTMGAGGKATAFGIFS